MKKRGALILFCTIFVSLTIYPLQRVELLNEKSLIIFQISDIDECLLAIRQSPLGQLLTSKKMKPFFRGQEVDQVIQKYIMRQTDQKKGEMSDLFLQALKLLKGEFIIGFSDGNEGNTSSFYIVAEMLAGDYQDLLRLDARLRDLENNIERVRRHQFRQVEILHFIRQTQEGTSSNWQAWVNDTLIYGPDRQWLESAIANIQQNDLPTKRRLPQLKLSLSKNLLAKILGGEEPEGLQKPQPDQAAILKAIGLDRFQGLDLYMDLRANRAEIGMTIRAEGMDKGIWRLLGDDPLPIRHQLSYVPPNLYSYQVLRLDIAPFWSELPKILTGVNSQLGQQYNMFLAYINHSLQVDLSEDIIQNLDSLVTNFSILKGTNEAEVFAWQLRDPMKTSKALAKLFSKNSILYTTFQEGLEIQNVKGYTLYTIRSRQDSKENETQAFTMTVVDRNWIIGEESMVRSYVNAASSRESQTTFYQLPLYGKMLKKVPERAVGYGLMDFSKGIKTMLSVLDLTTAKTRPANMAGQSKHPSVIEPLVDFSKLPSSAFISSFFSPGYNYIVKDKSQIIIKTTIHYPPKK